MRVALPLSRIENQPRFITIKVRQGVLSIMKPSKKIFLFLAGMTLLASCDSSSSASSSVISSDSRMVSITLEEGRAALIDAFNKTIVHDSLSLNGSVSAKGEFGGNIIATEVDGSVVPQTLWGDIDLAYTFNMSGCGFYQAPFQAAFGFDGHHDAHLQIGENKMGNAYKGNGHVYCVQDDLYFDIDEAFAILLNEWINYPYKGGKYALIDAIPDMPSPLLDTQAVITARQSFVAGLDVVLDYVSDFLTFYGNGTEFRMQAKITAMTLMRIAQKIDAKYINVADVLKVLSKASFKEAIVTFDFDATHGFRSLYAGLDLSIEGKVKDLFPEETGYSEEVADEKVKGAIDAEVNLSFDYKYGVSLPDDLDTYLRSEN